MSFGNHVDDLIKSAADEVHELELRDRAHPGERRAESRPDNGGLGNRRINHTLRAKAVDESVGDLEGPAVDADVLTNAKDGGIALHFLPDTLADGFEIGQLRHGRFFRLNSSVLQIVLIVL